uniref:Uncharacterized protein n=1 Tax=viral metagenome TaxID=1070528 RepID=A0A6M3IFG1_9ZZZZ
MAGKVVQEKKVDVSKKEDSLSVALDQAQETRMTGHPASNPEETDDQLLERQMREKAEKEKGQKPPEKKVSEEREEEDLTDGRQERISKPDVKEPEEEEEEVRPPRKPKFDTVEDADKALQEAERKMHKKAEEAAETRRLLSSLQDQMNNLLLSQVEGKKEKEKAEQALQSKEMESAQKGAIKEMLKVVRNLDPEADDYDEKYSEAMGGVFKTMKEDLRKTLMEETELKIKEVAPPKDKEQDLWKAAVRIAKAKGLDMNPEESVDDDGNPIPSTDYEIFQEVVYSSPGKTLKEQVENAVKKVERIKTKYQAPLLKARKKGEAKEEEDILGSHSRESVDRDSKPVKPLSLSEVIHQTQRIV